MSTLDDRIAAAFGNGVKSDDVAALITETEAAVVSANEAADRARTRALDPALSAKGVAEARRSMEDAAFARDRLQAAVPRLQERLAKLRAAEEDARRWAAYEKAKAERDRLAEETDPRLSANRRAARRSSHASRRQQQGARNVQSTRAPGKCGVRSLGGGSRPRPVRVRKTTIRTECRDLFAHRFRVWSLT